MRRSRLLHVGYVTALIAVSVGENTKATGLVWDERVIHNSLQMVSIAFLSSDDDSSPAVELVELAGGRSPMSRFLAISGGLDHICIEVTDLQVHVGYPGSPVARWSVRPWPRRRSAGGKLLGSQTHRLNHELQVENILVANLGKIPIGITRADSGAFLSTFVDANFHKVTFKCDDSAKFKYVVEAKPKFNGRD